MIDGSLARGVPFGRFHTLYQDKRYWYKPDWWLARSRGAFWEVPHFIPGKKLLVWLMACSLKGCHLGGFTLYTWLKKYGMKPDCWLARSRGVIWEVWHFLPGIKNIGIKSNCWLARSRGAFLGVSYFIPGKINIGIKHDCWLARSRGAIWEVTHFIPG